MYESKRSGQARTTMIRYARVWDDRALAERWADQDRRDAERGRGGVRIEVVPAPTA